MSSEAADGLKHESVEVMWEGMENSSHRGGGAMSA